MCWVLIIIINIERKCEIQIIGKDVRHKYKDLCFQYSGITILVTVKALIESYESHTPKEGIFKFKQNDTYGQQV